MKLIKKTLTLLLTLVMLITLVGGITSAAAMQDYYEQELNLDEPTTYVVKQGAGIKSIADDLAERKILESPKLWALIAQFKTDTKRIQVGTYELTPGMKASDLLDKFTRGEVIQHRIVFVEGRSFKEIRQQLLNTANLKQSLAGLSPAGIMANLGYPDQHPEGRFFPDTYYYNDGMSDADILQLAYAKMEKTLAEEWAKRDDDLPYKSAYEALIMASIVEKETGAAFERPQIAGLFVRRLKIGMKLQTDPTIIYGLGDRYDGDIKKKDINEATAYNTYVIKGLPPTPIAMPGLHSIQAALNPADGDSLYFVSKGDGTHHFSKTYAEHRAAIKKYILNK